MDSPGLLASAVQGGAGFRPYRAEMQALAAATSYLVRNRILGPPLENNPEIPPSSRDEGLRLQRSRATPA